MLVGAMVHTAAPAAGGMSPRKWRSKHQETEIQRLKLENEQETEIQRLKLENERIAMQLKQREMQLKFTEMEIKQTQMEIQRVDLENERVAMAMGYKFYFFNFIIMMSSCHMSTEIQIPNPNVDIIAYQPISGLEK